MDVMKKLTRKKDQVRLRIGLVQSRVTDSVEHNLQHTANLINDASRRGAEIVCLQELFHRKYFAQSEDPKQLELAEPNPGKTSRFLAECARDNSITLVGGSIYEKARNGRRYNTALVFDSGGKQIGKYRKMHIPHDPKFYEQFYFAPGNLGYIQVATGKVTIAPLICYDQWFPESARMNAIRGAQVLCYPTAIGWFKGLRQDEPYSAQRWEDAICAHASMNGVFAVAVNRVGREEDLRFWGGSFISDPYGQVVARASRTKEEVVVFDIDLRKVAESQEGWGFLSNRRPDSYRGLSK